MGVILWSPLGGGLLTGKYRRGAPLPESVRAEGTAQRFFDRNFDVVETLGKVAEQRQASRC